MPVRGGRLRRGRAPAARERGGRSGAPHWPLLAPHRAAAARASRVTQAPLVQVEGLVKRFPGERALFGLGRARRTVHAVDGVSFAIAAGEKRRLGGESGGGKAPEGGPKLRAHWSGTGAARARCGG